jgi:hypothetical protein
VTGWSYSLLPARIRSRGGTAVFLGGAFGTGVAGPLNLLLSRGARASRGRVRRLAGGVAGAGCKQALAAGLFQARRPAVVLSGPGVPVFCLGLAFVNTARVSPTGSRQRDRRGRRGDLLGYEGFELIATAPGEARNPARTLPRPACSRPAASSPWTCRSPSWPLGNLAPHAIAAESGSAPAAAACPFSGPADVTLIAAAPVASASSPINATLCGTARFTCLMGRGGELPARFGQPG